MLATGVAVLFGSQTGTAESIAHRISKTACDAGFNVTYTGCLNDAVSAVDWKTNLVVVCVTATTGDGDPPDNATKYWRLLGKLRREKSSLSGLKYALLGTVLGYNSDSDMPKQGWGIRITISSVTLQKL